MVKFWLLNLFQGMIELLRKTWVYQKRTKYYLLFYNV